MAAAVPRRRRRRRNHVYLLAAWLPAEDGDLDAYDDMRNEDVKMHIQIAEHLGITPGELSERQERGWGDELERAWGVIQQVAKLLLTGAAVTDAVVRELVEGMWDDYTRC